VGSIFWTKNPAPPGGPFRGSFWRFWGPEFVIWRGGTGFFWGGNPGRGGRAPREKTPFFPIAGDPPRPVGPRGGIFGPFGGGRVRRGAGTRFFAFPGGRGFSDFRGGPHLFCPSAPTFFGKGDPGLFPVFFGFGGGGTPPGPGFLPVWENRPPAALPIWGIPWRCARRFFSLMGGGKTFFGARGVKKIPRGTNLPFFFFSFFGGGQGEPRGGDLFSFFGPGPGEPFFSGSNVLGGVFFGDLSPPNPPPPPGAPPGAGEPEGAGFLEGSGGGPGRFFRAFVLKPGSGGFFFFGGKKISVWGGGFRGFFFRFWKIPVVLGVSPGVGPRDRPLLGKKGFFGPIFGSFFRGEPPPAFSGGKPPRIFQFPGFFFNFWGPTRSRGRGAFDGGGAPAGFGGFPFLGPFEGGGPPWGNDPEGGAPPRGGERAVQKKPPAGGFFFVVIIFFFFSGKFFFLGARGGPRWQKRGGTVGKPKKTICEGGRVFFRFLFVGFFRGGGGDPGGIWPRPGPRVPAFGRGGGKTVVSFFFWFGSPLWGGGGKIGVKKKNPVKFR